MSENLLNRKACRDLALRYARDNRKGCSFERVSKDFLDDVETRVRMLIVKAVKSHRSVGKTIKDFL